jgi:hypothetical protein
LALIYFFNKDVGENIKLKEAFMGKKEKWGDMRLRVCHQQKHMGTPFGWL